MIQLSTVELVRTFMRLHVQMLENREETIETIFESSPIAYAQNIALRFLNALNVVKLDEVTLEKLFPED